MDLSRILIRKAMLSDLDDILLIENRAYTPPWSAKQFQDCYNDRYQIEIVLHKETILGYWVIQPILDELHILNFCVNPDHQGQGIGRELLSRLVARTAEQPFNRILLEVRRSNKAARALYRGSGFEHMGVRKNYYPTDNDTREDAITMQMLLGG